MPWERALVLNDDDVLRGDVITELSCNSRLDVREIERRHGVSFGTYFAREMESLRDMQRDGLVTLSDDRIELTPSGRYLVRNACMVFDAWLPRETTAAPRYSSTV
jgi:oxygen-independent coproporphyrinogen-3 oxidase